MSNLSNPGDSQGWPTTAELEQVLEVAKARVTADMPYVYVGEARVYQYHADTKRFYVEVDVTHADEEKGAAIVLCRVSLVDGQLKAIRVTVVEAEEDTNDEE